jgi:hypothetical protein
VATLEAFLAVAVGVALSVGLAWLILSGLLGAIFKRARSMLRRVVERRRTARPGAGDRRSAERRRS